jgi:uroporphyrinogen III methyltransferase/synthase
MNTPCVYIIGAGPGDPSLISLRGRRLLAAADVVIYDHRVHPHLLAAARPGAERIDVGAPAPKPVEQDAISFLIAEKAREGRTVARLKWGDPLVFDSGGKEALFLHEQGIPFEIVPGIPAAIGAAAYAGVPITYPGAGDVLVFVRGHEAETDAAPDVDWQGLAQLQGTIACYGGAKQIAAMTRALLTHGRNGEEPAVLIYNGTLSSQQTVGGTLADIGSRAREDGAALLLIGPAAGLRDHLRWVDDRPLFGK